MPLIYYAAFFIASYPLLLAIFGWSTYHSFFIWAAPLLAAFSFGQAYLLCVFGLASFFVWHLVAAAIIFVWWGFKTRKQVVAIMTDPAYQTAPAALKANSVANTMLFFLLSVLVYLGSFTASFLYIYNTRLL